MERVYEYIENLLEWYGADMKRLNELLEVADNVGVDHDEILDDVRYYAPECTTNINFHLLAAMRAIFFTLLDRALEIAEEEDESLIEMLSELRDDFQPCADGVSSCFNNILDEIPLHEYRDLDEAAKALIEELRKH